MRTSTLLMAMALAASAAAVTPALAEPQDKSVCYVYAANPGAPQQILRLNIQSHSKLNAPTADAPAQFTYSVAGKYFGGVSAPIVGSILLGAGGAGAYMVLNAGTATPLTVTCTTPSSSAIPASWTCRMISVDPSDASNPSAAQISTFGPVQFSRVNPSPTNSCDTFKVSE